MSGPTTADLHIDEALAVLSAAMLEAENMREAHAEAREELSAALRNATREGVAARDKAVAEAAARFENLAALAQKMGLGNPPHPARPAAEDAPAMHDYLGKLQGLADTLENMLLTEAAHRKTELADLASGFELPAHLAKPAQTSAQTPVQRQLARVAHLGALPEDIAVLAREIENTPPGERAELLQTELARRIQLYAATVKQAQLDKAKALIVEHTLKDLGYQVEDIGATLFVSGGIVHFRKREWGNYMVRMRIDAGASTANFNVIRAVEAGANERSVLDHLAEDRWCAEFPTLLKALAARGLNLEVTRRLDAGELPVQLVERDRLPRFTEEEVARNTSQPLARELK